jgi:hypothetical protein
LFSGSCKPLSSIVFTIIFIASLLFPTCCFYPRVSLMHNRVRDNNGIEVKIKENYCMFLHETWGYYQHVGSDGMNNNLSQCKLLLVPVLPVGKTSVLSLDKTDAVSSGISSI